MQHPKVIPLNRLRLIHPYMVFIYFHDTCLHCCKIGSRKSSSNLCYNTLGPPFVLPLINEHIFLHSGYLQATINLGTPVPSRTACDTVKNVVLMCFYGTALIGETKYFIWKIRLLDMRAHFIFYL